MNRLPGSNPLIERAISIAEKHLGSGKLALRLKTPEITIQAWRLGQETMPPEKFLELVDILTEINPGWNEWNP